MEKIFGKITKLGNSTIFAGGRGGIQYSLVQVDDQLLQNVAVSQALDNFLTNAFDAGGEVTLWTIHISKTKMRRLVAIEFQNGKRYVSSWWQGNPYTGMIFATVLLGLVIPGLILWGVILFDTLPQYRSWQSLTTEKPDAIVLEDR